MARMIVVLGPTGAGKSVQANLLATGRGGVHYSSGALLRSDPGVAAILATGALVPDEEVQRVVDEAVNRVDVNKDIVLDGFPRTVEQAEWLERRMKQWGRTLEAAVLIEISPAVAAARLLARGRNDDTVEAQREKLVEYETMTRPVIEFYRQRGCLSIIDGDASIEAVAAAVKAALR